MASKRQQIWCPPPAVRRSQEMRQRILELKNCPLCTMLFTQKKPGSALRRTCTHLKNFTMTRNNTTPCETRGRTRGTRRRSVLTVSVCLETLLCAWLLCLGLLSFAAALDQPRLHGRTYWLDPANGKCSPSWAGLARRWLEEAGTDEADMRADQHHLDRRHENCISTVCTQQLTQSRLIAKWTTKTLVRKVTRTSAVKRLRTLTVTQAQIDLTGTKVVLATANLAHSAFYELRTTSTIYLPNPTATAVATITANAGLPPFRKRVIVTYTSVRLLTKEVRSWCILLSRVFRIIVF